MKFIFLAAGLGLRMGHLTQQIPKALLQLSDGRSILETNIDNLSTCWTDEVVTVVGGHAWPTVERFCREYSGAARCAAIFNSNYASTGPILSIRVALDHLEREDGVAIANGDTVFSRAVFEALANVESGAWLVVSDDMNIAPDEMGVVLDANSFAIEAGKSRLSKRSGLVSAGLLAVRGQTARKTLDECVDLLAAEEAETGKSRPWHRLVATLTERGVRVRPLYVTRGDWMEFDHQEELRTQAERSSLRSSNA